jgi:hypothetical protein
VGGLEERAPAARAAHQASACGGRGRLHSAKRRLTRRDGGRWPARRVKAPATRLPRPRGLGERRRRGPPPPSRQCGFSGAPGAARPSGIGRAAKGWARPPLDEPVSREEDWRRAGASPSPVPQGRSAAPRKEDGPAGPRPGPAPTAAAPRRGTCLIHVYGTKDNVTYKKERNEQSKVTYKVDIPRRRPCAGAST